MDFFGSPFDSSAVQDPKALVLGSPFAEPNANTIILDWVQKWKQIFQSSLLEQKNLIEHSNPLYSPHPFTKQILYNSIHVLKQKLEHVKHLISIYGNSTTHSNSTNTTNTTTPAGSQQPQQAHASQQQHPSSASLLTSNPSSALQLQTMQKEWENMYLKWSKLWKENYKLQQHIQLGTDWLAFIKNQSDAFLKIRKHQLQQFLFASQTSNNNALEHFSSKTGLQVMLCLKQLEQFLEQFTFLNPFDSKMIFKYYYIEPVEFSVPNLDGDPMVMDTTIGGEEQEGERVHSTLINAYYELDAFPHKETGEVENIAWYILADETDDTTTTTTDANQTMDLLDENSDKYWQKVVEESSRRMALKRANYTNKELTALAQEKNFPTLKLKIQYLLIHCLLYSVLPSSWYVMEQWENRVTDYLTKNNIEFAYGSEGLYIPIYKKLVAIVELQLIHSEELLQKQKSGVPIKAQEEMKLLQPCLSIVNDQSQFKQVGMILSTIRATKLVEIIQNSSSQDSKQRQKIEKNHAMGIPLEEHWCKQLSKRENRIRIVQQQHQEAVYRFFVEEEQEYPSQITTKCKALFINRIPFQQEEQIHSILTELRQQAILNELMESCFVKQENIIQQETEIHSVQITTLVPSRIVLRFIKKHEAIQLPLTVQLDPLHSSQKETVKIYSTPTLETQYGTLLRKWEPLAAQVLQKYNSIPILIHFLCQINV